jgi:menaquinone-specific isochorismate synthase
VSVELIPRLVARLLDQTKGPLFFLKKTDGRFVLGWGAKRESLTGCDPQEAVWLGGKSFFSNFSVEPQSLKPAKVQIWQDFPEQYFFVPRFFVEGNFNTQQFTYHDEDTTEPEDKAWENFLLETQQSTDNDQQQPLHAVLSPHAKREWDELCEKIENSLLRKELEKVVPARKKTFIAQEKVDSGAIFCKLLKQAGPTLNIFAFRHNRDVFLGATPEVLFSAQKDVDGFKVQVPAIAGTRAPGEDLGRELLNSEKDLREHEVVVRFIANKLRAIGSSVDVPSAPVLLKLPKLQHLFTPVTAHIKNHARVLSLLDALHPTPAVGGYPQAPAMELLARHELWERGYFASPLGFTFGKTGESCFVVGIRSCLVSQEKVHVFAGAGYVAGSSADDEWDETQVKIDSVLQIFGDLKRAE